MSNLLCIFDFIFVAMASSTLDSTAAFEERARAFGVENWVIAKFKDRNLNTFGRFAFAVAFNP